MSINIHHGYELPHIQSFAQAIAWKNKLCSLFEATVPNILRKEIAYRAIHHIDHFHMRLAFNLPPLSVPRDQWTDPNALAIA